MKYLPDKATTIRLLIMLLGLINGILAMFGKSPLPFDSEVLTNVIAALWATGGTIWTAWKNTNLTPAAKAAQIILQTLKEDDGEEDLELAELLGEEATDDVSN